MIAVIADDFTGAAEIAGIGLRYTSSIKLITNKVGDSDCDLLIVCTDSRSLNVENARRVTEQTVSALLKLNPEWIYKKTDSVLRGHVVEELEIQMQLSGLEVALLLPANPSLQRTIKGGKYYVNDILIHETSFANDPEFAITSADIKAMMRTENLAHAHVLKRTESIPSKGIAVCEVATNVDFRHWHNKIASDCLFAGAGDFFDFLAEQYFDNKVESKRPALHKPFLYVTGTTFARSTAFLDSIKKRSSIVHYLELKMLQHQVEEEWYRKVDDALHQEGKAIIAIENRNEQNIDISALQIRTAMAKVVKQVIEKGKITELFIEGGSTAAAILQELELSEFRPTHELSRGVVRMQAMQSGIFVTVKPGSYELPALIKELFD